MFFSTIHHLLFLCSGKSHCRRSSLKRTQRSVNPLPNKIKLHSFSIDKSFIIHRSRHSKDDQDGFKTVQKQNLKAWFHNNPVYNGWNIILKEIYIFYVKKKNHLYFKEINSNVAKTFLQAAEEGKQTISIHNYLQLSLKAQKRIENRKVFGG